VTTIYVTHDQTEAMTLADRAAILRDGQLQQFGHPRALFDEPCNAFVAGFIGSPQMNLVRGRVESGGAVRIGSQVLELGAALHGVAEGRDVLVGLRPEDLRVAEDGPGLEVVVDLVEWIGREAYVHFAIDASTLLVQDEGDGGSAVTAGRCVAVLRGGGELRPGARLRLHVSAEDVYVFDAATQERLGATRPAPAVA